jgi:hypothetical protein
LRQSHGLLDAFFEEKKGFANMAYKAAFARFIAFIEILARQKGLISERTDAEPPQPASRDPNLM